MIVRCNLHLGRQEQEDQCWVECAAWNVHVDTLIERQRCSKQRSQPCKEVPPFVWHDQDDKPTRALSCSHQNHLTQNPNLIRSLGRAPTFSLSFFFCLIVTQGCNITLIVRLGQRSFELSCGKASS